MFVLPKPGMRVRDPVKKDYVPEDGREVGEATAYWRRRISDGDAAEVYTPPTKAAHASKKGSDTV